VSLSTQTLLLLLSKQLEKNGPNQPGKIKLSHYRPGQDHRVPGGWGVQISRHSANEGGKVVSPTHRPPILPPSKYPWYSFLLEGESTPGSLVRPEGLYQWKIAVTPSEIEPATFRLVAQCLNRLRHRVPQTHQVHDSKKIKQVLAIILTTFLQICHMKWYECITYKLTIQGIKVTDVSPVLMVKSSVFFQSFIYLLHVILIRNRY
jgi:hypothetical protein